MNNCTIVIFGMSGDLNKRKLIPSLYKLIADKKIDNFVIIGAAADNLDAHEILERARPFIPDYNESCWQLLKSRTFYQQLNFENKNDYVQLLDFTSSVEQQFNLSGSRIMYCATAAHFFCTITNYVAQVGLAKRCVADDAIWYRIVYEKPFGNDLNSAQEINNCIAQSFNEHQIYRIDHYLTKEIVSSIALVRFTNCVFEPLWNNRFIDQVQIILSEQVGIESRGAYYDFYGALCDVVQNHILELMALIGMEAPKKLTGNLIRTERARVLEKIKVVDGILGQYDGYRAEEKVAQDSKTETFAALCLMIDNPRWKDVPFYIKTGKCLDKKETVIHIKFKPVECLLTTQCPSESNWLTIEITPEAAFILRLNAKKPGTQDELVPIAMEFCHSCVFGPQTPEAYEVLFEEIMRGEQSISVRFDEIEYAWQVIDHIKKSHFSLYTYEKQTQGPPELEAFMRKHDMRWRS